jgi:hypothetical protein
MGHLNCFQSLVIVNSTAVIMDVQVALFNLEHILSGCMHRSDITKLHGISIVSFFEGPLYCFP